MSACSGKTLLRLTPRQHQNSRESQETSKLHLEAKSQSQAFYTNRPQTCGGGPSDVAPLCARWLQSSTVRRQVVGSWLRGPNAVVSQEWIRRSPLFHVALSHHTIILSSLSYCLLVFTCYHNRPLILADTC